jgi:membrane-bound metal-dependent hydrolase YbcI (DUF457 family)
MQKKTHAVVTAVALYSTTADPLLSLIGVAAASLPDHAEKYLPFCKHRGITHWLLLWIGLSLFCFYPTLFGCNWITNSNAWWKIATGVALGGLCHVLQDALSLQGVPIVHGIQLRMGLYSTGTKSEYAIAALLCFTFASYYFYHN